MAGDLTSLAYHEPAIVTILNHSGFLLSLNLVNAVLDKLVYCGLIGQLFIGILWGMPGAQWLDQHIQQVIQQLGYLGLIALVYEGGISVSFSSLRANLARSVAVATTGIAVPIGLSFVLMQLVSATPLQAFAAGAALSATSLGTTFTILSTTGLMKTRLGVVTTSAAMLDDVVGLVMVEVITNLSGAGSDASFDAVTVVRPIVVSIGFAIGLVLACRFLLKPLLKKLLSLKKPLPEFIKTFRFAVLVHTCVLVGLVAGATYAGASSLFAAYLAGATISWFDENFGAAVVDSSTDSSSAQNQPEGGEAGSGSQVSPTGESVYELYYKEPVNRILKPLFFASVGFAIPITEMFDGEIVWRGIVYAVLMAFAKLVTGLWLYQVPRVPMGMLSKRLKSLSRFIPTFCAAGLGKTDEKGGEQSPTSDGSAGGVPPPSQGNAPPADPNSPSSSDAKPTSLYPYYILGLSMVARGEIGYLIASLAETGGVFSADKTGEGSSEIYLVVIWAITLCTLFGPIAVGTIVRRVKRLQSQRESSAADPLGAWGI